MSDEPLAKTSMSDEPLAAISPQVEVAATQRAAADAKRADQAAHTAAQRAEAVQGEQPSLRAQVSAQGARKAAADADVALAQSERAAQAAVDQAEQTDQLLLDEQARRVAAQVSDSQPFGLPGKRSRRRSPLRWGFTVTAGGLLALLAGKALVTVRHELLLILIAAFVAIGLDPAVRWLVTRGLRRSLAVAVIAVGFLVLVGGFIAAAVPPLVKQATQLSHQGPTYLKQLSDRHSLIGRLNLQFHVVDHLKAQSSAAGALNAAGGVIKAGTVVLSVTFEIVIVLVLIIYFLADLPRIKDALYRLAPRHRRPRLGLLGDEVIARVGGYVLGNVLTSLVAAVGNYVVLLALHVPYALVLSILVGVLDLIPLVGSSIGGAIVALIALAAVSGTAALITVIYHVGYRLFEDYLLNPRVLRRTVDVSPVVTVIAVLIGGGLLGVTGALIAVPTAAAIQLLLQEVVYPQRDNDLAAPAEDQDRYVIGP